MDIVYFATSFAFFFWTVRNVFYWTALWQQKEYRLDRMLIHFRETGAGFASFFEPLSLSKILLIVGYGYIVFHEDYLPLYQFLITIVFFIQAVSIGKQLVIGTLKKPIFTPKAQIIILTAICAAIVLYIFPIVDKYLWILLIDKIVILFIGFIIFGLSFPTEVYRDIRKEKAMKIIQRRKDLLVIGITGSYGKSSTKEYLKQTLLKKFHVVASSESNNTMSGIVDTILEDVKKDTQVLIVEMSAYKRGEIMEICQLVKPLIGIVTSVNDQYLSLFKHIESTQLAQYELIESLPKKGLAIFNGNNSYVSQLYKQTKAKKVLHKTFYNDHAKGEKLDAYASNIKVKKKEIVFDAIINSKHFQFHAPLIGAQNVENILPALYVAQLLKVGKRHISHAISELKPLPNTMIYHELRNGIVIIDDTFNANPEAVVAVLRYMSIYNGKKMLIMQPMIELGARTGRVHYNLAKEASNVCNYIFLTNNNFYSSIINGAQESRGASFIQIAQAKSISDFIKKKMKRGDVIVFEGREARHVLQRVLAAQRS